MPIPKQRDASAPRTVPVNAAIVPGIARASASIELKEDDQRVDPTVSCSDCDAVCCRLTVVVMPEDNVPEHMIDRSAPGLNVMARGEDGWCVAVDPLRLHCTIYEQRPGICRRFTMGSAYCRDERAKYRDGSRSIPLQLR